MRTLTALLLVLMAVAVLGLASDRSHVDSQVTRGPNRAYAPGVANQNVVVPFDPNALWYTVIVEVEVAEWEPLFYDLGNTKIQRVGTGFMPRVGSIGASWELQNITPNPPPDPFERCVMTRIPILVPPPHYEVTHGAGTVYVGLNVHEPEWAVKIGGCRDLGDGVVSPDLVSLNKYLKEVFPLGHRSEGLIIDTFPNSGGYDQCITHHGEVFGQTRSPYVMARVRIFIWTPPCTTPPTRWPF